MLSNYQTIHSEEQRVRDEYALAHVFSAIIIGLYLTNVAVGVGRFFGITSSMVSVISKVLILGTLIRCVFIYLERPVFVVFVSTLTFGIVSIIQTIAFPDNCQYMRGRGSFFDSTFFIFLVTILPAIYTIAAIEDFDILLRCLQNTATALAWSTLLIIVLYGGTAFEKYSMGFAGAMILPSCLMVTRAAQPQESLWKKWMNIILAVVDVFAVAMYGSRGGFIAIVAFIVYYFLWNQIRRREPKAIPLSLGILALAGNYKKILKWLNEWVQSKGYFSRTLTSLSSDEIKDSGRSVIQAIIKGEIKENPLQIRGINADYDVIGAYCHNWFMELIYAFGIILGGICCIVIIWMMIRVLWNANTDSRSTMMICLTFAFFPVCLVSGSIWHSTWFWTWFTLYYLQNDSRPSGSSKNGPAL